MRRIHLLRDDAFLNKAPQKIIANALDEEASNKRIQFIGMKPANKKEDKDTLEKKETNAMYGTYTPGAVNTSQTKLFFEN